MNPFYSPSKATKNFSNLQKITLEESCLILQVRNKDELTNEYIDNQFNKWYTKTKEISPYLSDRIEAAYERLKEEINS